jgi:hypothetical protein
MEIPDNCNIFQYLCYIKHKYFEELYSPYLILMYREIQKYSTSIKKNWSNTAISYWDYSFYSEFIYFFIIVVYSMDLKYQHNGIDKETNFNNFTLEAMEVFHYFHQHTKLKTFLDKFIKENTNCINYQGNNDKYDELRIKCSQSIEFINIRDNYTFIVATIEKKVQLDKTKYPLLIQNMVNQYEKAKIEFKKK